MIDCFQQIRGNLSAKTLIEARMDSDFFSERVVTMLDEQNIEFTQSVPFERFPALKNYVNENQDWAEYDDEHRFGELDWKPEIGKSTHFRFIAVRKKVKKPIKGPLQLDLFVPDDHTYEYTVILTNKKTQAHAVLMIQCAGRITKPGGVITLTMDGNQTVKNLISIFLTRLEATA